MLFCRSSQKRRRSFRVISFHLDFEQNWPMNSLLESESDQVLPEVCGHDAQVVS